MKRGKPLKRYTRLKSGGRLRPRKAVKSKCRFSNLRDAAFMRWIHDFPCILSDNARSFGCRGPIEGAHVRARGTGGCDLGNVVPMCRRHHRASHLWGIKTFQEFFAVDLPAIATQLGAEYRPESAA